MSATPTTPHHRPIRYWLWLCLGLVFLMIVVGGLTRLTESGLSIVEWNLISGILPPLNEAAWQQAFSAYQRSPQYLKINAGMTLAEFQNIFWLEYLHRLLGRLVGLVFFIPLFIFATQRRISGQLGRRLAGIFLLGALQGIVGWYMVKSGLVDEPRVSALRLTFHLGMAMLIFGALLWTVLDMRLDCTDSRTVIPREAAMTARPTRLLAAIADLLLAFLFMQILLGALVAGLDAGLTYNTFPLMDGKWLPEGLWVLSPPWRNVYENIALVQFNHRFMAGILLFMIPLYWFCCRAYGSKFIKRLATAIMVVFLIQMALGIATLLYQVPVPLASLHQANACLLLGLAVALRHGIKNKA